MITADTITDEQIRELRMSAMNGSPTAESCDIALGDLVLDGSDAEVEQETARARCAEILNARSGT